MTEPDTDALLLKIINVARAMTWGSVSSEYIAIRQILCSCDRDDAVWEIEFTNDHKRCIARAATLNEGLIAITEQLTEHAMKHLDDSMARCRTAIDNANTAIEALK